MAPVSATRNEKEKIGQNVEKIPADSFIIAIHYRVLTEHVSIEPQQRAHCPSRLWREAGSFNITKAAGRFCFRPNILLEGIEM